MGSYVACANCVNMTNIACNPTLNNSSELQAVRLFLFKPPKTYSKATQVDSIIDTRSYTRITLYIKTNRTLSAHPVHNFWDSFDVICQTNFWYVKMQWFKTEGFDYIC